VSGGVKPLPHDSDAATRLRFATCATCGAALARAYDVTARQLASEAAKLIATAAAATRPRHLRIGESPENVSNASGPALRVHQTTLSVAGVK
jgi:hypothetical protein